MARAALDTSLEPPTAEVARQVGHQGFLNFGVGAFTSTHFGACNLLGVPLGYEVNLSPCSRSLTHLSGSVGA